jgi:Uma2 family endonuclease
MKRREVDMAALPDLITVEHFRQLPEDGAFACELHHGEVVRMTRPRLAHERLQRRLARLLEAALPSFEIGVEYAFRPLAEFELRAADVAAVSAARAAAADPEDNLHGAPDLVIEVKSPSNTPRKLQELASLCLSNGAIEFWIVDRVLKSITVIQRDGSRETYGVGTGISLAAFGGASLAVAAVFE